MEKYKIVALIGIILLLYAGYSYYTTPTITLLPQDSYLNDIAKAQSIALDSGNFSAVQGLAHLTITPDNYIFNGTLVIITDDPQATIKLYSDIPLTLVDGGTGNVTFVLPIMKDPLSMDIIFTFSNTTITHQVTFQVNSDSVSNSTTVYANP
ncbi:hypothetical protein DRN87_05930 [Candidatus Geothermarchaeota archaeon]|nr:MAG: hypothetical protein DRN87_05930 [Candidatus Geothermarchaeota archaeon]